MKSNAHVTCAKGTFASCTCQAMYLRYMREKGLQRLSPKGLSFGHPNLRAYLRPISL